MSVIDWLWTGIRSVDDPRLARTVGVGSTHVGLHRHVVNARVYRSAHAQWCGQCQVVGLVRKWVSISSTRTDSGSSAGAAGSRRDLVGELCGHVAQLVFG